MGQEVVWRRIDVVSVQFGVVSPCVLMVAEQAYRPSFLPSSSLFNI
jgi:hypothetical protein